MTAHFGAQDLRAIADALDAFTEATDRTGVIVHGYGTEYITVQDHAIRLHWEAAHSDTDKGRYAIEIPNEN